MNNVNQKNKGLGNFISSIERIESFIRQVITFVAPNQEDLLKAGVYLDDEYDRLMVGGEWLTYEEMWRNNDERSNLLSTQRYGGPDSRVNEK